MDIQNISNQTELTMEEGYELTRIYVNYYWRTKKYYSLASEYEEDDVVQILMIKFIQHDLFAKYNSKITSKKYHIAHAVQTSMIDLLRKHREIEYLEKENEEGYTLLDTVEANVNIENEVIGEERRDKIIRSLPETSRSSVVGYSPLFNKEVNMSYKMLALHLEAGYRVKDMAQFYKNPNTGEPISEGTISTYIRNMREYVLDNIVIA